MTKKPAAKTAEEADIECADGCAFGCWHDQPENAKRFYESEDINMTTSNKKPAAKAAHTPGPWHRGNKVERFIYSGQDCAGKPIAQVDGAGEMSKLEEEANARLIAAAPDAHAILSLIADFINEGAQTIGLSMLAGDDEAGNDVPRTLRSEILRYMAKAEGREGK